MKKILSLCLCISFFVLVTGCGGIDESENQKAAQKLTSVLETMQSQINKLSVDTNSEYSLIVKEIYRYVANINDNPSEFNSQEKIDETTEQYNDYITKLKNIASKNNIELN